MKIRLNPEYLENASKQVLSKTGGDTSDPEEIVQEVFDQITALLYVAHALVEITNVDDALKRLSDYSLRAVNQVNGPTN